MLNFLGICLISDVATSKVHEFFVLGGLPEAGRALFFSGVFRGSR